MGLLLIYIALALGVSFLCSVLEAVLLSVTAPYIALLESHNKRSATELRRLNANFVSETAFRDFFATYVAVDGNIVTGQNQNSSGETAHTLLRILTEKN